ncbi:MAG: hypothetical protein GY925_19255 [Actinomycetia bacterium]|nr:hypothetical protein [Actinomycetes bacterium]
MSKIDRLARIAYAVGWGDGFDGSRKVCPYAYLEHSELYAAGYARGCRSRRGDS